MSHGKKASLHTLSREPLRAEDHEALTEELIRGTDRSCALIGCAMVDAALVAALANRFVFHDIESFDALFYSQTAPLSNLSGRTRVAQAIGIIGPATTARIDTIRRVRNAFAHSIRPLEFTHPDIEKECGSLPESKLDRPGLVHSLGTIRETYIANCIRTAMALEADAMKNKGKSIYVGVD